MLHSLHFHNYCNMTPTSPPARKAAKASPRSSKAPASKPKAPASKLDNKQIKAFRTIGHQLHPIVTISNGLSDNIHTEINRALDDHELIKLRINAAERSDKKALISTICRDHKAVLVQQIGNVALIFRAAREPNLKLSNLHRFRSNN